MSPISIYVRIYSKNAADVLLVGHLQRCQHCCVMSSPTHGQTITYLWVRQRSLPLWRMAGQSEPNSHISRLNSVDASRHILLTIPWLHPKDKLPQSAALVSAAAEGPSVITSGGDGGGEGRWGSPASSPLSCDWHHLGDSVQITGLFIASWKKRKRKTEFMKYLFWYQRER